jgi:hypothetical protein
MTIPNLRQIRLIRQIALHHWEYVGPSERQLFVILTSQLDAPVACFLARFSSYIDKHGVTSISSVDEFLEKVYGKKG